MNGLILRAYGRHSVEVEVVRPRLLSLQSKAVVAILWAADFVSLPSQWRALRIFLKL